MKLTSCSGPRDWKSLTRHELSALFPDAGDETTAEIQASMVKHGYRADLPIIIFEGQILDGWHRFCCSRCIDFQNPGSIKPTFSEFHGTTEEALDFVIDINLCRRQIQKIVKVFVIRGIEGFAKARAGRQNIISTTALQSDKNAHFDGSTAPAKLVTELAHVSLGTVRRADAIAAKIGPERVEQVIAGQLSVAQAVKQAEKTAPVRPGPPPRPAQRDSIDRPIHPKARQALTEGAAAMKDVVNRLRAIKRELGTLAGQPLGRKLHLQSIEIEIENVCRAVRFASPHTSCPMGNPCTDECTVCGGTQWVAEGQYAGIPAEIWEANT